MTQVTLFDGQMAGVSGDMLLGALIDAGANAEKIQSVFDRIPQNFPKCKSIKLSRTETKKHGFRACRAELAITEVEEESNAEALLEATESIARSADLSEEAQSFANNAMHLLAEVESKLHGVDLSSTHLHEAGSADTLADILGTAAACDSLQVFGGEIYSYPIAVGGGIVKFSHGAVSVPAPAVLEIARRYKIPFIGGPVSEELTTPTGVCILATLVHAFIDTPPPVVPEKVGYGAGKRDLTNAPNVVRVIIGQSGGHRFDRDSVEILETNLDDVPGEVVGSSLQALLDAGAKDAWITTAQFKKNRPGYTLHALCASDDVERVSEVMMVSTGTLGVRYQRWNRFTLQRETTIVKLALDNAVFDVRVKVATDRSGRILRVKPEFDDVEAIARQTSRSTLEISDQVLKEAKKASGKRSGV